MMAIVFSLEKDLQIEFVPFIEISHSSLRQKYRSLWQLDIFQIEFAQVFTQLHIAICFGVCRTRNEVIFYNNFIIEK